MSFDQELIILQYIKKRYFVEILRFRLFGDREVELKVCGASGCATMAPEPTSELPKSLRLKLQCLRYLPPSSSFLSKGAVLRGDDWFGSTTLDVREGDDHEITSVVYLSVL